MRGGDDVLLLSDGAHDGSGAIDGGTGNNFLSIDPGVGNSFAFSDSLLNFNGVQIFSGMVTLSGVSSFIGTTEVTGGILELSGSNRIAGSTLDLDGGTLETANTGG